MHPVGDTSFSDGGYEDIAEQNNGDDCRACHGLNGEGSVLSRAALTESSLVKVIPFQLNSAYIF
ncbi:MAG: cytochrome c [gamma proteobacterium symbiont of Bathyaustriella thionipta]|nr:cytochrome c [gamma proteobacterium symbiont of Bathyaustriella thionipta]MCU7950566.1 cytochrome c [gamma proteobacterium symbiont of Bathyaustriella thionipta]MCU7954741.1 cytochrome c [gamma proteobacterium symbiont of Bathyaustriella thionipta]MCU7957070.1 cytochrome c [gamma proteobacterium symbiont of Bathyaustriella thionipta]MCU7967955.1 cytochrome c [gamma proteobacterium symbiont of Bathyaustriella thionipta]